MLVYINILECSIFYSCCLCIQLDPLTISHRYLKVYDWQFQHVDSLCVSFHDCFLSKMCITFSCYSIDFYFVLYIYIKIQWRLKWVIFIARRVSPAPVTSLLENLESLESFPHFFFPASVCMVQPPGFCGGWWVSILKGVQFCFCQKILWLQLANQHIVIKSF